MLQSEALDFLQYLSVEKEDETRKHEKNSAVSFSECSTHSESDFGLAAKNPRESWSSVACRGPGLNP